MPESTVPQDGEKSLLARAVDGDEAAFTQLYDQHFYRIYRHVCYRVGQTQDAEDLTQQVFLQAWRGLKTYQSTRSPFIAWLLTIAHNVVVTFYRRHRTVHSLEAAAIDWPSADQMEAGAELRLEHVRVRRAMRLLRPEHQQVLIMRFLEDLGHRDIAAVLGRSEANVRVIQHRALQELRRVLDRGET